MLIALAELIDLADRSPVQKISALSLPSNPQAYCRFLSDPKAQKPFFPSTPDEDAKPLPAAQPPQSKVFYSPLRRSPRECDMPSFLSCQRAGDQPWTTTIFPPASLASMTRCASWISSKPNTRVGLAFRRPAATALCWRCQHSFHASLGKLFLLCGAQSSQRTSRIPLLCCPVKLPAGSWNFTRG
jgi:hypothetical protein